MPQLISIILFLSLGFRTSILGLFRSQEESLASIKPTKLHIFRGLEVRPDVR